MVLIDRDYADLPALDEAGEAHAKAVMDSLNRIIQSRGGFIGFDEYMEHALYSPGLGYYAAGATKLGEHGDYVTAPMISSLFSQTLAAYVGLHLPQQGAILELGAGTGIMAADILCELDRLNQLPEKYNILEVSADLRQRQHSTFEKRIPQLIDRIHWLDHLDSATGFRGIVLGNEIIDAMPVKRFVLRESRVYELGVVWSDEGPCWSEQEADCNLKAQVLSRLPLDIEEYPCGYTSEISQRLEGWLGYLSDYIDEGLMLFLDYGFDRKTYYQPQRAQGTLRGYFRHHAIDNPFFRPGLADITAWVDFTAIAEAADKHDLSLRGYTSQAGFLLENGLPEIFQSRFSGDGPQRLELSEEVKRLTLPGEMGETVKVMLLSKNCHIEPGLGPDLRYCL